MTLTNKEIVQGVFAELAKGNGRPFVDSMADDFAWTMPGNGTWSGTMRGKQAVREHLLELLCARFEHSYANEVECIVSEGDFVRGPAPVRYAGCEMSGASPQSAWAW